MVKWGHPPCATFHWPCFLTSANAFEIQARKLMSARVCVCMCTCMLTIVTKHVCVLRKDATVEAPLGRAPSSSL